jgi:hypothetical protein
MARHSRRSRKGGDKIDDIQSHIDELQKLVKELKSNTKSEEIVDEIVEEKDTPEEVVEEVVEEEEVKPEVDKYWVADKSIKFSDGVGGRVKLSFDRIITHLDTNIKKGNTKKNWGFIKNKMLDANSEEEVQDIIKNHELEFGSNYVAGTRRRKRGGKKRTSKRH